MAMSAAGLGNAVKTASSNAANAISAAGNYTARNGASSGISSALSENNATGIVNSIFSNTAYNNAWNAQQAEKANRWQEQMWQNQANFNAAEAAKNRNWQEMLANTAHQREVADLKAAGLNPILSAMNGNGASVGTGAQASVSSAGSGQKATADQTLNSALVQILGSMLSAQTTLEAQRINAQNNLAVADKYNATSELVANITGAFGLASADKYTAATRYAADRGLAATLGAASMSSAASRYMADVNASTQKQLARDYPSSVTGFISSLVGNASGSSGLSAIGNSASRLKNSDFAKWLYDDVSGSIVGGALMKALGLK